MTSSLFTKIINGEIPCHKLYEDEKTFVFLDIHPLQPGHCLVVPKLQVEFVWDLPAADYQALMATVQQIAQRLRTVMGQPYVSAQIVGVDVPHAHVHLIPFATPADLRGTQDVISEPDHPALAAIAARLAS